MKQGLTISCVAHAVALICGLVAISAEPMEAPPTASLPVDFISANDFSKMTKGVKNAPKFKFEDLKPLADKADAQQKSVDQQAAKVANKPEITTEANPKPPNAEAKQSDSKPAKSEAKQSDPKPAKPAEAKQADAKQPDAKQPDAKQPDSKQAEAKQPDPKPAPKPDKPKTADKPAPPKTDQIADELRKDDARKPPKPADKTPEKPVRETPVFDARQVAALLDRRDPQRQVATAETPNSVANLGAANGQAAQLSQSEIDALRARLSQCWNPPAGVDVNTKLYVVLHVLFKPDGTVAHDPIVVEGSASSLGPALAESGKRALLLCQPFTMLKPEHYDQWKDIEVKFDPHELMGG